MLELISFDMRCQTSMFAMNSWTYIYGTCTLYQLKSKLYAGISIGEVHNDACKNWKRYCFSSKDEMGLLEWSKKPLIYENFSIADYVKERFVNVYFTWKHPKDFVGDRLKAVNFFVLTFKSIYEKKKNPSIRCISAVRRMLT